MPVKELTQEEARRNGFRELRPKPSSSLASVSPPVERLWGNSATPLRGKGSIPLNHFSFPWDNNPIAVAIWVAQKIEDARDSRSPKLPFTSSSRISTPQKTGSSRGYTEHSSWRKAGSVENIAENVCETSKVGPYNYFPLRGKLAAPLDGHDHL